MVDDLEALRRGGRIPASVAVAGAALDVKPLLVIAEDGTLSLVGVARGRKKGIKQLAEYYKKNVDDAGQAHVAIVGHADCPKDAARLKEALEKEAPGFCAWCATSVRSSGLMWAPICWPWCSGATTSARTCPWPIASPAR